MRKITLLFFLLPMIVLTGCNGIHSEEARVTEDEAKQMIFDKHCREGGQVEILSVTEKEDRFIIQWENDPIEEGADSINKSTGELKVIEATHGTCKWL